MRMPVITYAPNKAVVNRKIIYSDNILSLEELGSDLIITSIDNISEYDLEKCLNVIFKNNSDVIFNTVQYSKKERKIYFYTDKSLSLNEWNDISNSRYKLLTNNKDVLMEVKNIFQMAKPNDEDIISLYDVSKIIKEENDSYNNLINKYENYCEAALKDKYLFSGLIIYGFDYNGSKNILRVGFTRDWKYDKFDEVCFSKENDDLYVSKSESNYSGELLRYIGSDLSILFDKMMDYSGFQNQFCYNVNAVNSNFKLSISKYGVSIYLNSDLRDDVFKLSSDKNGYNYDCNSLKVIESIETIKGKEDELFKRIFVKIDKCPKWIREKLKNNGLENEDNKILKFKNKILSLLKRN